MVSIFVKAAILTVLILGAWTLLSATFESDRNTQLLNQIDNVISEESAIQSYLTYLHSTGNEERFCSVLETHILTQNKRLFNLLGVLEQARLNSLNNQYPIVRKRFQAANAQLFFTLKQFEQQCPGREQPLIPILYFFSDLEECGDCLLQAGILDDLGKTCLKPVQIFAFPIEGGNEPIELLVKDYHITHAPTLVINDNVYSGVQSPSALKTKLNC
jgi:hypothetical protein